MPASPLPPPQSDTEYLGRALRASHLAHALDLITEPWCNMILRAAFLGTRQFEAFAQTVGAPRQTLSLRLSYLVDIGLFTKQRRAGDGMRQEYRLTPYGKSLHDNVLASWAWDRRWGDPHHLLPTRLLHRRCMHAFRPVLVCEHCGESLALHRVEPTHVRVEQPMAQRSARNRRWRSPASSNGPAPDRDILAVIDDRWSVLIVAALMIGASRYEQLAVMLQISSAVLARRLQRLCALEILINWQDPADARRSFYRLGKSGQDLFASILTLSQWGGQGQPQPDTIGWIHHACKRVTTGRMVCNHCRAPLLPHEVARDPLSAGMGRTGLEVPSAGIR